MIIKSSAFENNEMIPELYTCDGQNMNPPLEFSDVPEEAKSLVLIMDDPDVPKEVLEEQMYDHWVMFNTPPQTKMIPEGETIGVLGNNSSGKNRYTGPCPPPQYEPTTHRYFFKLYALDTELELGAGSSKKDVLEAIDGHVIEEAELVGLYDRSES